MADSFLALYTGTTLASAKLDSESLTVGANVVERERMQVAGAAATEIARVMATAPVGTEMGLVVRVLPGTGGVSLGKAVAATAGSTDTGVAGLLVRTDTLVTLTPTDGQYTYGRVDSLGSQWVTLSHMVQAIGSVAHDSADTQPPVKIGGYASAALRTAVTEADRVDGSFDLQGQMRVLSQGAVAHDAADAGNPIKIGGVANAALFSAVTEGDRVNASFDLQGRLRIAGAQAAGVLGVSERAATGTAAEAHVSVDDSTANGVQLIAANASGTRRRVIITNCGTAVVFVHPGATGLTAGATSVGRPLAGVIGAEQSWFTANELRATVDSGTDVVSVIEEVLA